MQRVNITRAVYRYGEKKNTPIRRQGCRFHERCCASTALSAVRCGREPITETTQIEGVAGIDRDHDLTVVGVDRQRRAGRDAFSTRIVRRPLVNGETETIGGVNGRLVADVLDQALARRDGEPRPVLTFVDEQTEGAEDQDTDGSDAEPTIVSAPTRAHRGIIVDVHRGISFAV